MIAGGNHTSIITKRVEESSAYQLFATGKILRVAQDDTAWLKFISALPYRFAYQRGETVRCLYEKEIGQCGEDTESPPVLLIIKQSGVVTVKELNKRLAIFSIVNALIVFSCLFLLISGNVNLFVSGFAVDSQDRLYVGKENRIDVYENGNVLYSINPRTSKSYTFTITNDTIVLSTASTVYHLDLEGQEISSYEDKGADTYNQINYHKRKFTSPKGDEYKLVSFLGRTKIVKNKTSVVYQLSLLSFAVKLSLAAVFISLFIFAPYMAIAGLKKRQEEALLSKDIKKTGDGTCIGEIEN